MNVRFLMSVYSVLCVRMCTFVCVLPVYMPVYTQYVFVSVINKNMYTCIVCTLTCFFASKSMPASVMCACVMLVSRQFQLITSTNDVIVLRFLFKKQPKLNYKIFNAFQFPRP